MDETRPDLVCPACGNRGIEAYCPIDGQRRVPATALDPDDPLIGKLLAGRYAIERRIGQGGMGAVYLATQALVERPVVVKVMRVDAAHDEVVRGRFLREARAASRVVHPNIITIYDFGYTDDGMAYLVMERVDGPSLSDVLKLDDRLPWRRAAKIVAQAARALDAAHKAGIVHRDVKPGNVMLAKNEADPSSDLVKVLDFGVARVLDAGDARLTRTGAVMGTPAYMAPEQASGREVGPAADIYALGAMLFDLITGDVPFAGNNITDVLLQHLAAPPPTMRSVAGDLAIPDELEALVAACLAKKPEQRPATAAALADELERIAAARDASPTPSPAPRRALEETGETSAPAPPLAAASAPRAALEGVVAATTPRPVATSVAAGEGGAGAVQTHGAEGRARPRVPWALVALAAVALLAVLVLVLAPRGAGDGKDAVAPGEAGDVIDASDARPREDTAGEGADETAVSATAPADAAPAGDSAAAGAEATPVALPPIPAPRGLRLDGQPID